MIKAISHSEEGRPLVVFGMSHETTARLMEEEPVGFNLAELLGLPIAVIVVVGCTEDDIITRLQKER